MNLSNLPLSVMISEIAVVVEQLELFAEELVDEVDLLAPKGRRDFRQRPMANSLTTTGNSPLPDLTVTPDNPASLQSLLSIRASHHQLAQLLAEGELNQNEISQITGYCISRISILKSDPLFKQLLLTYQENYTAKREKIFVDHLERMKVLGVSTLDELQGRLEDAPESFSRRELMEMVKLTLIDSRKAESIMANGGATASNGGAAISLNVKFVSPTGQSTAQSPPSPVIDLDGTPVE